MAENINVVAVSGNLTRDPELQSLPSGTSVCKLGIAVNERRKQGEEWVEMPNFFRVTVWAGQGEAVAKYLKKGSGVMIAGRLRWSSWEKDGQKRESVEIVAEKVQFMPKGSGGGGGQQQDYVDVPADVEPVTTTAHSTDDIPF
jgi:single-strand DNA-binding protein